MQPGSDQNHFCQPTDVAVEPSTGAIFVADGYCNSRIVQFSPSGKFITQWGEGTHYQISISNQNSEPVGPKTRHGFGFPHIKSVINGLFWWIWKLTQLWHQTLKDSINRVSATFLCSVETSGSTPKPGQLSVPHSLALVPHLDQLCVADRENGRIQCFRIDTKEFVREIKHASFGRNVFAISYIPGILLLCALLGCILPLIVFYFMCRYSFCRNNEDSIRS